MQHVFIWYFHPEPHHPGEASLSATGRSLRTFQNCHADPWHTHWLVHSHTNTQIDTHTQDGGGTKGVKELCHPGRGESQSGRRLVMIGHGWARWGWRPTGAGTAGPHLPILCTTQSVLPGPRFSRGIGLLLKCCRGLNFLSAGSGRPILHANYMNIFK